eukprot:TRINITY_DN14303_c0_g1_i1.p1 TRINITY_DN14303_c0_g1~~TRINITY_DN14303_c0_g1_i1.p1  ORF type:complete len:497 (+),score=39.54 TRINITY_DN14303_c0_g1_i1:68-1558(+)
MPLAVLIWVTLLKDAFVYGDDTRCGCSSFHKHCPYVHSRLRCLHSTLYSLAHEDPFSILSFFGHCSESKRSCAGVHRQNITTCPPSNEWRALNTIHWSPPLFPSLDHRDPIIAAENCISSFIFTSCSRESFFQAFLYTTKARVRVQVTEIFEGSHAAYFQPLQTGDYILELVEQYPGNATRPRWPLFQERAVATRRVHVEAGPAPQGSGTRPLCKHGPFSGGWSRLGMAQEATSSWLYVPHSCGLPWRHALESKACLQGAWILFHGDSTAEENALGFVRELLQEATPMKKERHSDPWRNFDIITDPGKGVRHFSTDTETQSANSTRITMRFNPSHRADGQWHHPGECDGLKSPDVFIFNSLAWDLLCMQLKQFRGLMAEVAVLLNTLHELAPGTLFIYRTGYGPMAHWRTHMVMGPKRFEEFTQAALTIIQRLPFLRVVDAYDVVQPWLPTNRTGDGLHLSVDPESSVVHSTILQLLLHEICIHRSEARKRPPHVP